MKKLVELPATYGRGKEFVTGSARVVTDPNGTFAVAVTLADGSEYRPYDGLASAQRAQVRVDDLNEIEE